MVLVIRSTRSDRGASPGRVSLQAGCHGTPSTRGKAPTHRGRACEEPWGVCRERPPPAAAPPARPPGTPPRPTPRPRPERPPSRRHKCAPSPPPAPRPRTRPAPATTGPRPPHPADPPTSRRPTHHEPRRPTDPSPRRLRAPVAATPTPRPQRPTGGSPPPAPPRRRRPAQAARAPVPTDYFPYPTRRTCAHTTRPEREEEAMTLRYRGAGHTGKDAETRGNEHGRQSRGAPPLGGRPRQPPRPQALLLPPARVSLQRRPGALYDSLTLNELHHRSRRQSRVTGRHPALKCNQHH